MKKKLVMKMFCVTVAILLLTNCVCVQAGVAETIENPYISESKGASSTSVMSAQLGVGLQSQTAYYIMNAVTGGLLSPKSLSDVSGTEVGVRGTRAEQMKYQWIISDPQSSTSRIVYANSASGKVLSATTSEVTLETSGSSASQRFSISRVQDGDYQGLYLIKSGGYYLTRSSYSSYSLHMVAVPNQYSYWSLMAADKGFADLYSFTYIESSGALYDSSANDAAFPEYMSAIGYDAYVFNNELAESAYEFMTDNEDVFVFRGHANANYLPFFSDNGQLNGAIQAGRADPVDNWFHIDDLNSNALSKQRVVLYLGCRTGLTEDPSYNLVDATFAHGAQFALGTTQNVGRMDSNEFLLGFMESAAAGNNVQQCIADAIEAAGTNYSLYPDTNGQYPVYYVGDTAQYLSFE